MRTRVVLSGGAIVGLSLLAATPVAAQEEEAEHESGADISHASEECIHILEGGGQVSECQEAPNPILPEPSEILWGGLSFLVLLVLLWKFALPAVQNAMAARTQKIRDNLDEADRIKSDAQRILEDYQRQLADAKNESARIIEEARQTAEQMRRDLMARAEAEVQELRARTADDVRAAQDRAMADLRAQVAELAVGAAEVVVQRNLDADTNRALVERFIEQVGTGSA